MTDFVDIRTFFTYCSRSEIATTVQIGHPCKPDDLPKQVFTPRYKAVWDTGATGTSISRELAIALGLPQIGYTTVQGVTGSEVCNTYLVSLILPNGVDIPELSITDCSGNIGCDVLNGFHQQKRPGE